MAFLSNEEINSIRAKADIVDIVSSYVSLTQKGKNYIGICPFHEDHSPSMSVSSEKQIYKCFSCGATGNVFGFVKEYENVSFPEAVKIVADKCGIIIDKSLDVNNKNEIHSKDFQIMDLAHKFYQNNLNTSFGKTAMEYLKNRGIDEKTIKEYEIGLSLDEPDSLLKILTTKKYEQSKLLELGLINENNGYYYDSFTKRIMFPLWDKDGNIVGFSGRIYRGEKDLSKYSNSRETTIFKKGQTLYNYHKAKEYVKKEKSVIIVEGFMDAIRLSVNDVRNVIALQGTSLTNEQIELIKKLHTKVILCLDNDDAGLNATLSNGNELIKHNLDIFVIRLNDTKDPDEYIIKNGIDAFKNNIKNAISFLDFKINYYKKDKDLTNSEDLANYINQLLKELSNEKDEILKDINLTKLSEEYSLSKEVLQQKLDELQKTTNKETIKIEQNNKIEKKSTLNDVCEKILYFMMNDSIYVEEYKNRLGFFKDSLYRQIANEIVYYESENKKIDLADFLTYVMDNDSIYQNVKEIINRSGNEIINIETMQDYLNAASKLIVKEEIKELKKQMKIELDINKKLEIAKKIADLKKGVC